jgi:DNA invertase Pin-like site-specific DNA recombinase
MARSNGQSKYESPDIAAMMKRMCRGMVRRAQEGDLEAVKCMAEVERAVRDAVVEAARAAHYGPYAYSWNEIARDLGVTRQAVQKRCALPADRDEEQAS